MSLEDRFNEFALESREFQGEMRAWSKNLADHLQSVSRKADAIRETLDSHKDDPGAHGQKAARLSLGQMLTAVSVLIGAFGLALALVRH